MILVDTSVWIDYLAGVGDSHTASFDRALGSTEIVLGDLILTELLQGLREGPQLRAVTAQLSAFRVVTLGGEAIARAAAANYRQMRTRGLTVRGTVDLIIATWCIENNVELLHHDRDFASMQSAIGLTPYR